MNAPTHRRVRLMVLIGALLSLFPAARAEAAQRWASPMSTDTTGSCTVLAPCQIDHAIGAAAPGDEVAVAPGEYPITSLLSAPVAIDLHGVAGQPPPHLVGASNLSGSTLSFKAGGTVRHLAITATGTNADALTLQGALGEDLVLRSSGGDGAKVVGAPARTVLRDTVVRTSASGTGLAALKLRDDRVGGGDVALRNVTAIGMSAQSAGILCETSKGQTTLVNTIARGGIADVDASGWGARCEASFSNFRPALSAGLVGTSGNQSAAPLFVDAAAGDFHPTADSPTVDAGTSDALLGSADPDGRPRTLGAAPDIGAYEYPPPPPAPAPAPPPAPAPAPPTDPPAPPPASAPPDAENAPIVPAEGTGPEEDALPPPAPPSAGRTINVHPTRGTVKVRLPGSERFIPLTDAAQVRVGSLLDARDGTVRLESARNLKGATQAGVFHGSVFQVRQRRSAAPVTALVLRGGSLGSCRREARGAIAGISRRRRTRRLWGRDRGGRFRTRGRHGSATVRGTQWLTEDRCDGTRYAVRRGSIAVRDPRLARPVIVRAGEDYLVRAR